MVTDFNSSPSIVVKGMGVIEMERLSSTVCPVWILRSAKIAMNVKSLRN